MQLRTHHRKVLYTKTGEEIAPDEFDIGASVMGFSNRFGKPNRRPLEFIVTQDAQDAKRFTRRGLFGT